MGKTCLRDQFINGKFDEHVSATIGASMKTKIIPCCSDGQKMKLSIWDTPGQERFDALTKMYFKGTDAFVIVYDISNEATFDKARFWIEEILKHEFKDPIMYLVANKCDLSNESHLSAKVDEYAKLIGALVAEVSS